MTGWADAGLVALGGVTTLVGGALEARRARRRDDEAHARADAKAQAERELDVLTALHTGMLDIWPSAVVVAHSRTRTVEALTTFALSVGRLKARAQRVQDETLRSRVREWVTRIGPGVMERSQGRQSTDEFLAEMAELHTELTELIAIRIRSLESGVGV